MSIQIAYRTLTLRQLAQHHQPVTIGKLAQKLLRLFGP